MISGVVEATGPSDQFLAGIASGGAPCSATDDAIVAVEDAGAAFTPVAANFVVQMN